MKLTQLIINGCYTWQWMAARGLLFTLALGGALATSSYADMFQPKATPGGIDSRPVITSVRKNGASVTVNFHGLQAPYQLQVRPGLESGNWSNAAASSLTWPAYDAAMTLNNLAGTKNFFRLSMTGNGFMGYSRCYGCHDDKINGWLGTAHSTALNDVITMPPSVQQNCLVCHSVGYGQPGGFVDTNSTPQLANVGCEACHGPAGAHLSPGGTRLYHPVNTIAAEVCGGCHNDSHNPTYSEWTNSPHAAVVPDVSSGFADTASGQSRMMSCGPCHSGPVRLAMLDNFKATLVGYTNTLALPSAHDASNFAQSCAVCHDPHSTNGGPYQLRNPVSSTNFFTFYTGSVSTNIYSTNVFGQVTTNTYYLNTVFSTQYVAQVQICAQCHNTRGARWTDTSRPPHLSPQYNILLGNVGVFQSGVQPYQPSAHARFFTNQCVDCHMQTRAYQSEAVPAITGHKFSVDAYDICTQCHGPQGTNLVDFAVNLFLPAQAQRGLLALNVWASSSAHFRIRRASASFCASRSGR